MLWTALKGPLGPPPDLCEVDAPSEADDPVVAEGPAPLTGQFIRTHRSGAVSYYNRGGWKVMQRKGGDTCD